ncbi:MAG: family 10 glycosylhydrolase [Kiritimatiellae bacterium]|nr:family 10 glycosylhydrolase [Kiritimatiellia bacterium]
MLNYAKLHPEGNAPFDRFRDAAFSYVDEPGSQIDAIWWDIGGNAPGSVYPSKVAPTPAPLLVQQWHRNGIDWIEQLVNETRRRKLEVFWNHRISEVDILPEGGHSKQPHPLKVEHPDWVVPTSWWPHGMWNLAAQGLREHKVAILREIATRFDLDGIQIDFARHVPCLPVGRQWELRDHVTQFMRMVRRMLLEVEQQRGRPFLLATRVPQTLDGCRADGFDVKTWAEQRLVDVLTLGSRSMDVDVEGLRAAVGGAVQLQPCFDDHHATDGYRYAPIEFLRGVFANHFQRGADSVMTFNWSIGIPEIARPVGGEIAPLTHQVAFKEVGTLQTMAMKDKIFAVERRGGYPWADGFFNRNDTAPLPLPLSYDGQPVKLILHVSDAPDAGNANLTLRCILSNAGENDAFEIRFGGVLLSAKTRDPEWKDAQIFSPRPQPASGGKGDYKVNPRQRLLRLDCTVPDKGWRHGQNEVEIRISARGHAIPGSVVQVEKLEAHLRYHSI